MNKQLINKLYESMNNKYHALSFDKGEFESSEEFDFQLTNTKANLVEDLFKKLLNDEPITDSFQMIIDEMNKNPNIGNNIVAVNNLDDLKSILLKMLPIFGNNGNYNWVDTSHITSLNTLFKNPEFKNFNGNICNWNVSHVENMNFAFQGLTQFNQDLSKWDLSNLQWCIGAFSGCNHEFANTMKKKISTECKNLKANLFNI